MRKIYEVEREFQVWRYTVSHRSLLLRSVTQKPLPSRIDIYFGHVEVMFLRPPYDGIAIFQAGSRELTGIQERFGVAVNVETAYVIGPFGADAASGPAEFESLGLVVSGEPVWHEDNRSAKDPSFFQDAMGNL